MLENIQKNNQNQHALNSPDVDLDPSGNGWLVVESMSNFWVLKAIPSSRTIECHWDNLSSILVGPWGWNYIYGPHGHNSNIFWVSKGLKQAWKVCGAIIGPYPYW
jgi:hypothetical protein